jgi:hypothetical protein
MSLWEKSNELPNDADARLQTEGQDPVLDPNLDQALRNFKLSVDAWSEAAFSNRSFVQSAPRRNWRPAAAWALGCALVASSVSGVVYQRHDQQVHDQQLKAQQAAAKLAEQQKQAADLQAANEEDLLASVDSDVSRQVPSAMEPLAQMAEDESK